MSDLNAHLLFPAAPLGATSGGARVNTTITTITTGTGTTTSWRVRVRVSD